MFPNLYKQGKYDLAKDLINELYKNIEPSKEITHRRGGDCR